jgi:hypothetical protein
MDPGARTATGADYDTVLAAARGADVLLNVSGMLDGEVFEAVPGYARVLDLDPAFNQLWHVVHDIDKAS